MRKRFILMLLAGVLTLGGSAQGFSYRYWFDNDASTLKTGTVATNTGSLSVPISMLDEGRIHAMHLQVRQSSGPWSSVLTRYFFRVPAAPLSAMSARYWFDNDVKTMHTTNVVNNSLEVDTKGLGGGIHALHYQALAADGTASPVLTAYLVLPSKPSEIASARYWFDNDASTMHLIGRPDASVSIDLDGLDAGLHAIHLQTTAIDGSVSIPYTRYFILKEKNDERMLLRTWFDDNVADALIQTIEADDDVEISTSELRRGLHTIHAQLLNMKEEVLVTDTLRFEVVRYKTIRLTTNADTYCADDDLDFSSVEGLRAYIIAGFNRQNYEVTALRISDAPAYEGLYIEGEPGEYRVLCKDSHTEYANLLRGTVETTMVQPLESGGYMNYVLDTDSGQPTFRPLFEATAIGPQKAWLHVFMPADHQRPLRIIRADEADAISTVSRQPEPDAVYSLSGRKLSTSSPGSLKKGVYIVNGKKMVIN